MPDVSGMTRAQADTVLRRDHLSLGDAAPLSAPLSWVVASQIPVPRLLVADGTPIQVFLAKPKSSRAHGTAHTTTGTTTTPKTSPAPKIVVPAVVGQTEAKAEAAVRGAGLTPLIAGPAIDKAPAGTVYTLRPAAGTKVGKGAGVQLKVSAGMPDIAYDNGTQIHFVDPQTGAKVGTVTPISVEPSFSYDGTQFVYRSDTRVFIAPTLKPSAAKPIYEGPDTYTNVTFAPDRAGDVLALDRQLNGYGELCLAKLTAADRLRARCLPDARWSLGGDIAWSPHGTEILAFGTSPTNSSAFGMVSYRSKVPFSTNPSDWRGGGIATDVSEPGQGVIDAAFSPNGTEVALVSDLTSISHYVVSVVPPSLLDPTGATTLPVPGCAVAWRSDDLELAILQKSSDCSQRTGTIVQVPVRHLRDERMVASGASDLTYQPRGIASAP
jgi:hypothetical protein